MSVRRYFGERQITGFAATSRSYNIIAGFRRSASPSTGFPPTTMSSYRNHRVIIASLFLPQTAVLGESPPETPNPLSTQLPLPSLFNLKIPERPPYGRNKGPAPLKSIVEDMRDKVSHGHQSILRAMAVSLTGSTLDREILTDWYTAGDDSKQRKGESLC